MLIFFKNNFLCPIFSAIKLCLSTVYVKNIIYNIIKNNGLTKMLQEQVQLRLLQQQHLKRLYELERERYMLNRQNPFKTLKENKDTSNIPILQANQQIEKMLYSSKNKPRTSQKQYHYPLKQIDAKIAQKSIQSILINWQSETKYIPNDIYLRNVEAQENQVSFDAQLTQVGKRQMQEMILESRRKRSQNSIKDKYSNSSYKREKFPKTYKGFE